jgi:hypothetical protein
VLFVCRSVLMLDSVEYVEFVLKYPSPVGIFWDLRTPDFSIVTDFVVFVVLPSFPIYR